MASGRHLSFSKLSEEDIVGKGELFSLASALCWAISVILFKRSGESMRPFALNLTKNLIALALMLPTLFWAYGFSWPSLPFDALVITVVSGIIGIAIADTLYFEGLNRLGASRMGVVGSLFSPLVILLSLMFLGEKLTIFQFIGFIMVLSGVMLVTARTPQTELTRSDLLSGLLIGALSVLLMAIGIVMVKRVVEQYDFLWVVEVRLLGGVAGMLLVMLLRRRTAIVLAQLREPHQWRRIIIASSLGTYLALMLWLAGYKYTLASIASVLNETASIFIVILAWLMLGESMTKRKVLGVTCSFGGVCMLLPETGAYLTALIN